MQSDKKPKDSQNQSFNNIPNEIVDSPTGFDNQTAPSAIESNPDLIEDQKAKLPWYKKAKLGKIITLTILTITLLVFVFAGYLGYTILASDDPIFGNDSEASFFDQFKDTIGLISNQDNTVKLKGQDEGRTNFLLLGRDATAGGITDTIILGSYFHDQKTIITTNLPRDILVYDGYQSGGALRTYKINASYVYGQQKDSNNGGEKAITDLISKEFEIDIHYWATIDIPGLIKGIDQIGGVEVNVEETFTELFPKDQLSASKLKECGRTVNDDGLFCEFTFQAGPQKMDGETAMIYARGRKYSSDFVRSKRQSQLIQAAITKIRDNNLLDNAANANSYFKILSGNFKTNMTIPEVLSVSRMSKDVDLENDYLINNWSTGNGFLCTGTGTSYNIVYCGGALFGSSTKSKARDIAKNQIKNLYAEMKSGALKDLEILVLGNGSSETDKVYNTLVNSGYTKVKKDNKYKEIAPATNSSIEIIKVYIPDEANYKLYKDINTIDNVETIENQIPSTVVLPSNAANTKIIFWIESI